MLIGGFSVSLAEGSESEDTRSHIGKADSFADQRPKYLSTFPTKMSGRAENVPLSSVVGLCGRKPL